MYLYTILILLASLGTPSPSEAFNDAHTARLGFQETSPGSSD